MTRMMARVWDRASGIRVVAGVWLVIGWVIFGALAKAQEEVAKEPDLRFRFLAVGNSPPFKQEIRNGIRYEVPPPPGSVPPRRLVLSVPGKEKDDEDVPVGELRLRLGRLSPVVKFERGEGSVILRDGQDGGDWLQIPRPEEPGNYLVVLRRDPKGKSWDQPMLQVIPDQAPAGSLTLFNLSGLPLAIVLGEEKLALASGKPWSGRLLPGKPVGFQVGLQDAQGRLRRMFSTSLEQSRNEKTLVIFNRADREDARKPIKMTVLREDARKKLPVAPAPE